MNACPINQRPATLPATVTPRAPLSHAAPGASGTLAEAASRATVNAAGQSVTPVDGSQVDLSQAARQLFDQYQRDGDGADIDMTRVQTLCEAIAAGALQIDTKRIADGLIASACELLQTARR